MKIAILGAVNIKHMSLISHYLDNINLKRHKVDIIYVDKYGIDEKVDDVELYKFPIKINPNWSKLKKAKEYYKFKPFAEDVIRKNNYDLLIVWGTYTGHLFKGFLKNKYKNKYILNVRDYFYENNKAIFHRMKHLVKNSLITTISSEGFLRFLPSSDKYQVIYSFNKSVIVNSKKNKNYSYVEPIKISFIGNNRFFEINKRLMMRFKNDERFQLQYFGTGSNILANYALENNINNIKIIDGFPIEKTSELLNQTDILNNIYGNNDIALETALSIRLYYSIYLNKPILTSPSTYTSKKAKELNLGFDINDLDTSKLGDQIIEWYRNLNVNKIDEITTKEIREIEKVNYNFYSKLRRIIENE
ncbi:capsular biosynthesis protein [Staphylococcus equorum]|uniref:capsular biosynthesis protein n=1 Tax=Staphylococcus equorum TaxID=246432 RepID=UPI000D1C8468|nr:capsular biosynthesis protein [Staphylococcus equorum]PTE27836.1 capsular biosynthesis protein [Staphylococcus equorum]